MAENNIPVVKNQSYPIFITAQGTQGEGIGKVDGFTVFVKNAVAGDELRVKILKVNKSYAFAKIESILTPSPARVVPTCGAFVRCGGCNLMHIRYEQQLKIKTQRVRDALERIGGFHAVKVADTIGMEDPYRYRNKMQFPVGRGRDGALVTGFFAPRSHTIVPVDDCLTGAEGFSAVTDAVKEFMQLYQIAPYDEKTHKGVIRHVFVRSNSAGEMMAVIVANALRLERTDRLVSLLRERVCGLIGVIHNINMEKTNLILGKNNVTLWGADTLSDTLGGLRFEISPHSFYQVNHQQTEVLYETALDYAGLREEETVFDLYCGIGTISLFLAKQAKKVIGIEIVPEAVEDARRNASVNGIGNAHFHCGAAEAVVPQLYHAGERADVVVIDPPRKGADEVTLSTILKMEPKRIVYVSCNPETLARDAKFLCESGEYCVKQVQPVDMFPHTAHVETVVLLSKLNAKQHIEVELNLDELDLTSAESKATYDEIKAYVLERHGLKVSSLYISQVKRKCGLDVGHNYNLSKKEDAKVPQCPPEKEAAIMEALKHFHMI